MNQKMIKKKITIPAQLFKNLVSKDTLKIIQILDKHSFSLEELKQRTSIPVDQLKIELKKLGQGNIVKEKQYQSKSSQYSLTFKGSSLLHPENSRIMILFSISILAIAVALGSLMKYITQTIQDKQEPIRLMNEGTILDNDSWFLSATETSQQPIDPFFSQIAIIGMMLFIILICITIWRYKKNRFQAL